MKDPKDCAHENFGAIVEVTRLLDTGKFVADVKVRCAECDLPFRFVGVPSGLDFERPMCSIDGTELRAPIEPELEAQLMKQSTFRMPVIPSRH